MPATGDRQASGTECPCAPWVTNPQDGESVRIPAPAEITESKAPLTSPNSKVNAMLNGEAHSSARPESLKMNLFMFVSSIRLSVR